MLAGELSNGVEISGALTVINLVELIDAGSAADSPSPSQSSGHNITENAAITSPIIAAFGLDIAEAAAIAEALADSIFTMYIEAVGLSDTITGNASTTGELTDSAALIEVIQQTINQIVADSAAGADVMNFGLALALVDIANAVQTQTSTYDSVVLVAELIASIDAYNAVDGFDITESGIAADSHAALILSIASVLEAALAVDVSTGVISVYQVSSDAGVAADTVTNNNVITAILADGAVAIIRLNIGGELFTGWVLNADTLAASEYQFADLQFNSACKHGDRYLMAADDGIYQFTEDVGVESVMTYIKTGKMDFGSDKHKRVINSYMVYSATGQMMLKVTTSENGKILTHNYQMAPFASHETTDTRRFDIGKGLKSRYWQFEVLGEGVDCEFDEIGMLPVILSRRI